MNALLSISWTWTPSVLVGFAIWTVLYELFSRSDTSTIGRRVAFHLGTLAGILALVSPIDELGDQFLFSAHMVQHLILMFVAAPLWLVGLPDGLLDRYLPERVSGYIGRLAYPIPMFIAFVGVLYFWHVPVVYNLALESENIHIFEHLTFMGAAMVGWWPVLGPITFGLPKSPASLRMLYLFLLVIPCTALAAVLTFARAPFYPYYANASSIFGLDALQDQRLGGLLMWLPVHMILLLLLGITFFNWFMESNRKDSRESIEQGNYGQDTQLVDLPELGV